MSNPVSKECDVQDINQKIIEVMDGEERDYVSIDEAETQGNHHYMHKFLHCIHSGSVPPHVLKLEFGCIVMALRSLNKAGGLMNGTRLQITKLLRNMLIGKIVTAGPFQGNEVVIPRIKLEPSDIDIPFKMTRLQIPI